MKDLVVYYSLEGNTKQAAEMIAQKLDTDILQIETDNKIPKSNLKFFIGGMQALFRVCVKIKSLETDPEKYDRIILGTPVWASRPAPAINTFLKKYNVKDKVTALFTCSGGGDNETCVQHLKKMLPILKTVVALADRNNPASSGNEKRIECFVEGLIDGR